MNNPSAKIVLIIVCLGDMIRIWTITAYSGRQASRSAFRAYGMPRIRRLRAPPSTRKCFGCHDGILMPAGRWSMTARTIRFTFVGELPCMGVGMAVCAFSWCSFVAVLVTSRTFDHGMLTYQRKRGLGMIKLNCLP